MWGFPLYVIWTWLLLMSNTPVSIHTCLKVDQQCAYTPIFIEHANLTRPSPRNVQILWRNSGVYSKTCNTSRFPASERFPNIRGFYQSTLICFHLSYCHITCHFLHFLVSLRFTHAVCYTTHLFLWPRYVSSSDTSTFTCCWRCQTKLFLDLRWFFLQQRYICFFR